ncbi:MAG: hypothetical protein EBR07_09745, partial [Planctomycetes bacterium]|nr:hypothetical protein [Planctomycetota bacterium]
MHGEHTMKNAAILLSLTLASMTAAQTQPAAPNAKPATAAKAPESDVPACLTPAPRGDDGGKARQDEVLRRVREAKAPVNVVFVGDSITQGWEDAGAAAWKRNFEPMGALQIGVGGDRTEHVLWRLQQAPLTPLDPKVIVLMIGTNNAGTGRDSGELIIRGIAAIVDLLHTQCPNAQVLVLDIPPRGLPINPLRGVVLAYLRRTSGYGRAQLTRLVARWAVNCVAQHPLVKQYRAPTVPFARKYTAKDVELLVEMDRAHDDVCGAAIAHLLQRAHIIYGDPRYVRLADLSVSHLYNLRKSAGYKARRMTVVKTRAVCNPIGVRKAPSPKGRAGYVRIDTVHQGDLDGVKGVYHITCVDEVSQWQVQACVQGISEAFLLPVLALVLGQFPFEING